MTLAHTVLWGELAFCSIGESSLYCLAVFGTHIILYNCQMLYNMRSAIFTHQIETELQLIDQSYFVNYHKCAICSVTWHTSLQQRYPWQQERYVTGESMMVSHVNIPGIFLTNFMRELSSGPELTTSLMVPEVVSPSTLKEEKHLHGIHGICYHTHTWFN